MRERPRRGARNSGSGCIGSASPNRERHPSTAVQRQPVPLRVILTTRLFLFFHGCGPVEDKRGRDSLLQSDGRERQQPSVQGRNNFPDSGVSRENLSRRTYLERV